MQEYWARLKDAIQFLFIIKRNVYDTKIIITVALAILSIFVYHISITQNKIKDLLDTTTPQEKMMKEVDDKIFKKYQDDNPFGWIYIHKKPLLSTDHIMNPTNYWLTADEITLDFLKYNPNLKVIDVFVNLQVSGPYRISEHDQTKNIKMFNAIKTMKYIMNNEEIQFKYNTVKIRANSFFQMLKYPNVVFYDFYVESGENYDVLLENISKSKSKLILIKVADFQSLPFKTGKYRILYHEECKLFYVFSEYNGVQMKNYGKSSSNISSLEYYHHYTFNEFQKINNGDFYHFLLAYNIINADDYRQ